MSKLEGAEDGLLPVLRDGDGAGQVFDLEVRQHHYEKLGGIDDSFHSVFVGLRHGRLYCKSIVISRGVGLGARAVLCRALCSHLWSCVLVVLLCWLT